MSFDSCTSTCGEIAKSEHEQCGILRPQILPRHISRIYNPNVTPLNNVTQLGFERTRMSFDSCTSTCGEIEKFDRVHNSLNIFKQSSSAASSAHKLQLHPHNKAQIQILNCVYLLAYK